MIAIALALVVCSQATGPDTVWLKSDSGPGLTRIAGEVRDFSGAGLRLRLASGREVQYSVGRVDHVETQRTSQQQLADDLLLRGESREALERYAQALSAERRAWVQREIVAGRVRALVEVQDYIGAGENFLMLLRNDPQSVHFGTIPLVWQAMTLGDSARAAAQRWLESTSKIEGLLGASLLLESPHRAAAVDRLRSLATDEDQRIAWLASAQLWRVQTADESPSALAQWQREIEAAPFELRAGAWFVLGEALRTRDDNQQAALALLRVPLQYGQQRDLAGAALWAASVALEQAGLPDDAQRLRQELLELYPETRSAQQARAKLD